jgi:hypothetical protein
MFASDLPVEARLVLEIEDLFEAPGGAPPAEVQLEGTTVAEVSSSGEAVFPGLRIVATIINTTNSTPAPNPTQGPLSKRLATRRGGDESP